MFMNEYEIEQAKRFADTGGLDHAPNLKRAVTVVFRLCQWTNMNSDGWPYWTKPCRAAAVLTNALQDKGLGGYRAPRVEEDIDSAVLKKGIANIKRLLTTQKVNPIIKEEIVR